jgi:hypothetical protein
MLEIIFGEVDNLYHGDEWITNEASFNFLNEEISLMNKVVDYRII